jgi:UDP-N-acetylmuramate dehydrogenase
MIDPSHLPPVRGKLLFNEPLAPFTWFRVGGPAEALFLPADPQDLSDFLRALPEDIPVTVLGVGSNVIIRDGGVEGVVIRLAGKGFGEIAAEPDTGIVAAGVAALDANVARAAAKAGIAGLEFLVGVPGTIGGALTMNAGCYGRETKDVLVSAWGYDRTGEMRVYENRDMGFSYRANTAPGVIWVQATFQGEPGEPAAIDAKMAEITAMREGSQPIREKTGGSTFKNPPGDSAWKVIDRAGFRGARRGGAQVSEKHCNFLINTGEASAADLEDLGEEVRAGVKAAFDIDLHWEIKRIGRRL